MLMKLWSIIEILVENIQKAWNFISQPFELDFWIFSFSFEWSIMDLLGSFILILIGLWIINLFR